MNAEGSFEQILTDSNVLVEIASKARISESQAKVVAAEFALLPIRQQIRICTGALRQQIHGTLTAWGRR